MKRKAVVGAMLTFWLLLWANDTGVLLMSREDPDDRFDRICTYGIGLTVIRKRVRFYGSTVRCSLFSRV